MYQILSYVNPVAGVADVNVDMTASPDPNFSRRGGSTGFNHFIFTEPYRLQAAYYGAVSALRAQISCPSWNAIALQQIYPPNLSLNIPSDPRVRDLRRYAPLLPINEEVAVLESNTLGAATEQTYAVLFISPQNDQPTMPTGVVRIMARATSTLTGVADTWSADAGIQMVDPIKGGTYAIVGMQVVGTAVIAARLNLVRAPVYQGRKLQAGCLGTNAIGDKPLMQSPDWLGEMGRFNNFELPQLAVLASASGAVTVQIMLDLVYMGEGMALGM